MTGAAWKVHQATSPTASRQLKSGCIGCLAAICGLLFAPWIGWDLFVASQEAKRIPDKLSVGATIYQHEESFGFGGPGDAETGLTLYHLSKDDAKRLLAKVKNLTNSDDIRQEMGRRPTRRDYYDWHATPFDLEKAGFPWDRLADDEPVSISKILYRGGAFGIVVDSDVAQEVDAILNAPGSFYASGPGSTLIVVAPTQELVIFAHAG